MADFPEPREFQVTAHEKLREGFRAGHRLQVLMAATGAGKSYLGLRVIKEALQKGKRAIFLCDRRTLIEQTSETATRYGLTDHGIIQAQHWRTNLSKPFQIASVQTIAKRGWPEADVIVVDECHTMVKAWTEHVVDCKAAVIGLSATPFSRGLGKIFTRVINAATMHELTKQGVLVPMRVFSGTKPDMEGAKVVAGEWSDSAVEERGSEIVGDVVAEWQGHAADRKTICFGATIAHCEEIAARFNAVGVMAAVFCATTNDEERTRLLDEYRKPDSVLRVLVSVEALAKGFDVPDVSCVIDCRPLRKSLSTAIQMWGRGLRSHPSKSDCILMDHSGNAVRFRKDFEEVYFNGLDELDSGEKLDREVRKDDEEIEERSCPGCGAKPFHQHCVSCGYESTRLALVNEVPGQMQELEFARNAVIHDQTLWAQVCAAQLARKNPENAYWRARHTYKGIVGAFPPKSYTIHAGYGVVAISSKVHNYIRHQAIAWAKSKERQHAVC